MSGPLMLDTNALSAVMKARSPDLDRRLATGRFCISVVTEAEIRFGLAHRPQRAAFAALVSGVLGRIDIRPWTSATARRSGPLRAEPTALGQLPAPLDLLIAAHALAEGANPDHRRPRLRPRAGPDNLGLGPAVLNRPSSPPGRPIPAP